MGNRSPCSRDDEDSGRGRRVLTVEDDADVAESFRLRLEMVGHDVRLAANGADALDIARQFRPHVAFIDIDLPGMDGYEVARYLRRECGDGLRLFALTGFGQESVRERVLAAGFERHLIKPIDVELLQQLLAARPAPG